MPAKIDQKIEVPLATDGRGRALCPHCRGVLMKLLRHARLVENLTPSNLEVTQFNTAQHGQRVLHQLRAAHGEPREAEKVGSEKVTSTVLQVPRMKPGGVRF
jgi:hypothetical protein